MIQVIAVLMIYKQLFLLYTKDIIDPSKKAKQIIRIQKLSYNYNTMTGCEDIEPRQKHTMHWNAHDGRGKHTYV